jgi:co-chaperonin GroES (HSP10)
MKAVGNNIVILPKKVIAEKTKGGLLLMEKDKENIRYKEAVVVAVSDEIKFLQPGMEIYYDKHAGHGIEFEDEKYTIIKLQDVVIVL